MGKRIYIAAETIVQGGGLGNYLTLLVKHMQQEYTDITVITHWGIESTLPGQSRPLETVSGKAKKLLKKILSPGTVSTINRLRRSGMHGRMAAIWKEVDDREVCLLPHIIFDRTMSRYYDELARKNLIWVVHDLHPYYFPDAWSREYLDVCRTLMPELARNAKKIITHTQFTKGTIIERLKCDPEKIHVIRLPHIFDEEYWDAIENETTALPENVAVPRPYAIWPSSSTFEHKNHLRLLRAWRNIQKKFDITLVCTGNREPNWHKIEEYLKGEGKGTRTVFTGTLSKKDVIWLQKHAVFAVCPTLFEGGGSGPVVESMFLNVPVACSNIPQIREQLDGRDDLCMFFDPEREDSIVRAVCEVLANRHSAGIRDMVERAGVWVRNHLSWKTVVGQYRDVFEEYLRQTSS